IPAGCADVPAARETRIKRQRPIDQRHHRADVLAEIGQRESGIRKDRRIVAGHLQGPSCEIDALPAVRVRISVLAIRNEQTTEPGPAESGPVTRIALDCLLRETKSLTEVRSG